MDPETEGGKSSHKGKIAVALISATAVVVVALFGNWDKIFPPPSVPNGSGSGAQVTPPEDPARKSESICKAGTFDIPDQTIRTSGNDASTVNGDSEIDSNDWTRVSVEYKATVSQKTITLNLTWEAQELNGNKSPGDTRIKSRKTVVLYKVPSQCTKSVITGASGLDTDASQSREFRGPQHDLLPFASSVGNIRDINVRFDGPGRSDHRLQQLEAVFKGFSVSVSETP